MWKKTFLYLGIFAIAFLIGHYCGHLINVICNVKYDFSIGLGILFLLLGFINILDFDVNNKKIKYPNQIKIESGKRLPYYGINEITIFCIIPIFLLLFMFIGSYIYQYILLSDNFSISMFWVVLISALTILLIVLLIVLTLLFDKGSLLNFEKELSSEFNIIEKENKKIKNKKYIPSECLPASRITYTKDRCKYIYYEYLKLHYEKLVANIGLIGYRKGTAFFGSRYYSYQPLPYESNIFISIELPYKFKKAIYIGYTANVDEIIYDFEEFKNNLIIPKYSNIPIIIYTDKEYTEKILSESVQKKISDLARYIRDFNIEFYKDKITLVIPDSRWSSIFARNFNKKKNVQNILKVTETVLASLKEISDDIEKNDAY